MVRRTGTSNIGKVCAYMKEKMKKMTKNIWFGVQKQKSDKIFEEI